MAFAVKQYSDATHFPNLPVCKQRPKTAANASRLPSHLKQSLRTKEHARDFDTALFEPWETAPTSFSGDKGVTAYPQPYHSASLKTKTPRHQPPPNARCVMYYKRPKILLARSHHHLGKGTCRPRCIPRHNVWPLHHQSGCLLAPRHPMTKGDFRSPLKPLEQGGDVRSPPVPPSTNEPSCPLETRPTLRGLDARQPHRGWMATGALSALPGTPSRTAARHAEK